MDLHAITELSQAVAAAVAFTRLVFLKFATRFPALLAYLAFLAVINLGFGLVPHRSAVYFWAYLILEPVKCILSIIAVQELFSLEFRNYPGIRSASLWVMYGAIAASLMISAVLTEIFWKGTSQGRAHSHLFYFEIGTRSVVFSLAVVIIANLWLVSKYPLHLGRNTLVSSAFFSFIFLSDACRLLFDSLMPLLNNPYIDSAEAVFTFACLVCWALMAIPETAGVPAQVRYSTPQEDHLLAQLNLLNQMMTRSVRR